MLPIQTQDRLQVTSACRGSPLGLLDVYIHPSGTPGRYRRFPSLWKVLVGDAKAKKRGVIHDQEGRNGVLSSPYKTGFGH